MLVVLVLFVFSYGFVQLLSQDLHLLIQPIYNVLNLLVDSFLSVLLLFLLLNLSPNISPPAKSFHHHSSVVTSLRLSVFDF